ncbi:MAG TPA: PilZ domain-containing protein [Candidatus Angelobacter sp.]
MSSRRTLRRKIVLPVTLTRHGGQEKQLAHTLELTENSARLGGLSSQLKPGETIELYRGALKARFDVVWMGEPHGAMAGQAGIRSLEPDKIIWRVDLPADEDDSPVPVQNLRRTGPAAQEQGGFAGEKRRHPRFACTGSIAVTSRKCAFPINGEIKDISRGGLYVEVNTPLPVNSEVSLAVCIEGICFESAGVVRTSYPLLGMGISFQNLSQVNTQSLAAILDKVHLAASGKNTGSKTSEASALLATHPMGVEAGSLARVCHMLTHDFENWEQSQSSTDVADLKDAICELQRKFSSQNQEVQNLPVEAAKPVHPSPEFVPRYHQ